MKTIFSLPIFLIFLLPTKTLSSISLQENAVCIKFAVGEIDAYKTLEDLGIDIGDYSIGVINTAKIVCA